MPRTVFVIIAIVCIVKLVIVVSVLTGSYKLGYYFRFLKGGTLLDY
jgi:hypothetical protein